MHVYAIVRGIKRFQDLFIDEIRCRYLPQKVGDKYINRQIGVRPVQLYEFAIPEEQLDNFLELIGYHNKAYKWFNKAIRGLGKLLGLKSIKSKNRPGIIPHPHTAVHFLGTKKDKFDEKGEELI